MSVPKFAFVRFLDDEECRIVRVADDIKHFDPLDHHDSKIYMVRRSWPRHWDSGKENHGRDDSYETLRQKAFSGPRSRIRNMYPTLKLDTDSGDDFPYASPKSKSSGIKVSPDRQGSAITNKWITEKVEEDLDWSMTPASQSQELAKDETIRKLKEERAALQQKLQRLETLNFKLQEEIIALSKKARLADRPDDAPTPPKQSRTPMLTEQGEATSNQLYTPNDGKVQLLGGIEISEEEWCTVNSQRTNSLFVKSLAVAIWGSTTLRDRSVCGRVCPRFIHTAGTPPKAKPPLSPRKLNAVKACFTHHLNAQGLSAEAVASELRKMNNYITEKIQDLNRAEVWQIPP